MSFSIFDYLDWKMSKHYGLMPEKEFLDKHENVLTHYGFFSKYEDKNIPFNVIKKSIIARILLNKIHIEEQSELYSDVALTSPEMIEDLHNRLPYFIHDGIKIYVPIFSPEINERYANDIKALAYEPYSNLKTDFESASVNPFVEYNLELFNSDFTHLIYIMREKNCAAFYHATIQTVFIINDQGGLDEFFPLFDSGIKEVDYEDFFPRLTNLLEAYFNFDGEAFISRLYTHRFISEQLYRSILENENKDSNKRYKRKMKALRAEEKKKNAETRKKK